MKINTRGGIAPRDYGHQALLKAALAGIPESRHRTRPTRNRYNTQELIGLVRHELGHQAVATHVQVLSIDLQRLPLITLAYCHGLDRVRGAACVARGCVNGVHYEVFEIAVSDARIRWRRPINQE